MKRHQALIPLSREHHGTLILAQLLKKGTPAYRDLPATAEEKASYAIEMFESSIKQHFIKEEEMFELVKNQHEKLQKLVAEIITEHRQLTTGFNSLKEPDDLEAKMDELGKSLEWHIRKEERILFPLIEQHCSPAILAEIEL